MISLCCVCFQERNVICSRFYRLRDKQAVCKRSKGVCEQASLRLSSSSCLRLNPLHRQGPLPRPFPLMRLVGSGWTGLRSEVVSGWWLSGETSQELACLTFSSSDGGVVVFRERHTVLEEATVHRQMERNSDVSIQWSLLQSSNLKILNRNTTYIPNIINRQEQIICLLTYIYCILWSLISFFRRCYHFVQGSATQSQSRVNLIHNQLCFSDLIGSQSVSVCSGRQGHS